MRNPPSLYVSIQSLSQKSVKGQNQGETNSGFGILVRGTLVNAKRVDESAVEVVEEIRRHEN
jgi:hypothetical protein